MPIGLIQSDPLFQQEHKRGNVPATNGLPCERQARHTPHQGHVAVV